jgi:NADH dehydrogenase FAD-containing subunit
VGFLRETVRAIDPSTGRVTTSAGVHDCDFLVVALGADKEFSGLDRASE